MRVIVAGSREIRDIDLVFFAMASSKFPIRTVISGGARGVDTLGEQIAKKYNINLEIYPADWNTHGKSAGYKRNELMASKAEGLVAIWDGQSRGTKHMIDIAKRYQLKIYVYNITLRLGNHL